MLWSPGVGGRGDDPGPFRGEMALRIGQGVLDEAPGRGALPFTFQKVFARPEFRQQVFDLARSLRQEADVRVVRGLLALEEGQLADAEADFSQAVGLWQNEAACASGGGLDFSGRIIAQDCLEWLRPGRPVEFSGRPRGGR